MSFVRFKFECVSSMEYARHMLFVPTNRALEGFLNSKGVLVQTMRALPLCTATRTAVTSTCICYRFARQYLIARSLEWKFLKKKTPAFFEVFVKVAKIQRYEAGATIFKEGVRA